MSSSMDIPSRSFSRQGPNPECAFPSWPRRSLLNEDDSSEERATSYIPDDELLPDAFKDDTYGPSSHGSSSPAHSLARPIMTEALKMQHE